MVDEGKKAQSLFSTSLQLFKIMQYKDIETKKLLKEHTAVSILNIQGQETAEDCCFLYMSFLYCLHHIYCITLTELQKYCENIWHEDKGLFLSQPLNNVPRIVLTLLFLWLGLELDLKGGKEQLVMKTMQLQTPWVCLQNYISKVKPVFLVNGSYLLKSHKVHLIIIMPAIFTIS